MPGWEEPAESLSRRERYPRLPAALLAVALAAIFGLPHLVMWSATWGTDLTYLPLAVEHVQALTWDETTGYAPRFRAAYEGQPLTADPAGWEHRQRRGFLGAGVLEPILAMPLMQLVGGNTGTLFAIADFVLPPVLFLLLLWLGRELRLPFWVAACGGVFLLLAYNHLDLPFRLLANPSWSLLSEQLGLVEAYRPVEYSRFPVPQSAYGFLLLAVISLHALGRQPRWTTGLLAAVAVGALFYMYVFFWTYILAGAVLWGVSLLLEGRRGAGLAVWGAAVGGCLLGLPVLLALALPEGFPGKEVLQVRQGWGGRQVIFWHRKWELAVWLVFLGLSPWRDRRFPFLLSFLVAPYLCLFGARVVGMNVQEWHWLDRCGHPWMALALVVAFWSWLGRPWRWTRGEAWRARSGARLGRVVLGGLLALTLLYGLNLHLRYGLSMAEQHAFPADQTAALRWLDTQAPRDSVVAAADCNVLALVPVYTRCHVYLPFCLVTPAEDRELIERFWITVRLLDLEKSAVERFLGPEVHVNGFWHPHRWWMVNWLFHMQFRELRLPAEALVEMERIRAEIEEEELGALLQRYRMNYVWVDSVIRQYCRVAPEEQPHLEEVFRRQGISLLRVNLAPVSNTAP